MCLYLKKKKRGENNDFSVLALIKKLRAEFCQFTRCSTLSGAHGLIRYKLVGNCPNKTSERLSLFNVQKLIKIIRDEKENTLQLCLYSCISLLFWR